MFYNAKNGNISVGNSDMDYISFGNGKRILIMLPGVGDGLITVKGKALFFAMMYKTYAKNYTVYVFSRKNNLPDKYSTREMAKDQAEAMKILGIDKAYVLGVSQGGMIAQYLAVDYPALVEKLALVVTLSKPNEIIKKTMRNWIRLAKKGDYKRIMIDNAEKSYSENYLKKYRLLYPFFGRIGRPEDFGRFITQCVSCVRHNAYPELNKIICPVLIIGGDNDRIVGVQASVETAEKIKNSSLFIYKGLGHALYEEAKDFNDRIRSFFEK